MVWSTPTVATAPTRTSSGLTIIFETYAVAIDDAGSITGHYVDANHLGHGFVHANNGKITVIDPAGSVDTEPYAINLPRGHPVHLSAAAFCTTLAPSNNPMSLSNRFSHQR
jgi:hypothetical protein